VELHDAVNLATGEASSQLQDGGIDQATGPAAPLVMIAASPSPSPSPELADARVVGGIEAAWGVAAAIESTLLQEEISTIAAAKKDMEEAGIAKEAALAMLEAALTADPTLEELTTITAAMIDLHQAGATPDDIMGLLRLLEEQVAAGMERTLLLEEISTIAAAKVDLLEAEMPAATALAVLRMALQADPTLEELTTITAAIIDLVVDEGLSAEEALARIQAAIEADPTLENLDDLIDNPNGDIDDNDDAAGAEGDED
jgi:tetratricopeptide (TPR) repeat protein